MTAPTSIHAERRSRRSFTASDVCAIADITYRQLDYWTRTGLVEASGHPSTGYGDNRWYRDDDVLEVCAVAALLRAGMGLAAIRGNLGRILADGTIEAGPVRVSIDAEALTAHIDRYRRAAS